MADYTNVNFGFDGETDYFTYNYVRYCPYCGQPLKMFQEYMGHGEVEYYYRCECEDAKLAKSIDDEIKALIKKIPKRKYGVVSSIQKIF